MKTPPSNTWLHRGGIEDAIAWRDRIELAPDVGYVYVLALSNGTTKVGSTAYFPQRLATHRTETSRYGLAIECCYVTRPHFNFRAVEAATNSELAKFRVIGEVFKVSVSIPAYVIESQELVFVAPATYGRDRRSASQFLITLMTDISQTAGILRPARVAQYAERVMAQHKALGLSTGLDECSSMLNAMAVIEANTDLDLSSLRDLLLEVA